MEREDRPHAPLSGRLWLGAPVAMVLATCVSAQASAADEIVPAAMQPSADLGCVVRGEASHARKALAHQAAHAIQVVDRIACNNAFEASILGCVPAAEPAWQCILLAKYRRIDPAASNHQTSAP
jgi:hypothetical protein